MARVFLSMLLSLGIAASGSAAPIIFDFTGSPTVGTFAVQSTNSPISVLLSGVQFNTGNLDPSFQVSRDYDGVGIRSSGDTSDFIEQAGANDRIRFDFGGQSFDLVSLTLVLPPSETTTPISIWTGGEGDTTAEITTNAGPGVFVPSTTLTSTVFDFGSASTTGFKVAGATFEGMIPEPGTGLLVIAGLLGFAGWRRAHA